MVIQNFEVLKASFLSCIYFLCDLLLLFASLKCLVIGSYLKSEAIKITDSESFVHMGKLHVKGSGAAGLVLSWVSKQARIFVEGCFLQHSVILKTNLFVFLGTGAEASVPYSSFQTAPWILIPYLAPTCPALSE